MLLPSALPCDVRRSSRFSPSRLFSTPLLSDTGYSSGNGLQGTCRALQALINGSPTPSPRMSSKRLQSPPPIISPRRSPRLRKVASAPRPTTPPITTVSTPPPAPKRINKRRCSDSESDLEERASKYRRFATPTKDCQLPYNLPIGLFQTDFYSLHSPPVTESPPSPAQRNTDRVLESSASIDPDSPVPSIERPEQTIRSGSWTTAQDERLFELVLEKFALSHQALEECARRMGRSDAIEISNRLQSFLGDGRVTLRPERQ